MTRVEIYTTMFCPFCSRAKRLLSEKGAEYEDIDVIAAPERRQEMIARAHGARTVPQIFINGKHVGGCEELYALDRMGRLDSMLREAS
jgi:glutaredoxin 3